MQSVYSTTPANLAEIIGPGSNSNEGVLHTPQSSWTEASPSDCSVSYPGHLLEKSYSSAQMQSVYSTAPANLAENNWIQAFAKSTRAVWNAHSLIQGLS